MNLYKYLAAFSFKRSGEPPHLVSDIIMRRSPIIIDSEKDKQKLEEELCQSHLKGLKRYAGDTVTLLSCQRLPIQ